MPTEFYTLESIMSAFAGPIILSDVSTTALRDGQSRYSGSSIIDAVFALRLRVLSNNWWLLGRTLLSDEIADWVVSGQTLDEAGPILRNLCATMMPVVISPAV